jgi:Protein of unknown function (DUF551)
MKEKQYYEVVSVEDEVPDKSGWYNCYTGSNFLGQDYFIDGKFSHETVTHWLRPVKLMSKEEWEKWISVEDDLPYYDVDVLIYWRLEKDKNIGGYYDMIEIAHLTSVTQGKGFKSQLWENRNYDGKKPTHWQLLPAPPKQALNQLNKESK